MNKIWNPLRAKTFSEISRKLGMRGKLLWYREATTKLAARDVNLTRVWETWHYKLLNFHWRVHMQMYIYVIFLTLSPPLSPKLSTVTITIFSYRLTLIQVIIFRAIIKKTARPFLEPEMPPFHFVLVVWIVK